MRNTLALFLFLLLALLPVQLFSAPSSTSHSASSKTLDEFLSLQELQAEFNLPGPTAQWNREDAPLTPAEVKTRYGVDVFQEFPVVVIVNTAAAGTTAQHLTVYQTGLPPETFLTSTGRDQWELPPKGGAYFSNTPSGWFAPTHFVKDHFSSIWEASMEFSIFFNGGIAIHATTEEHYADLGHKASGGCVRLTRENAERLFNLTVNLPRKVVPVFNVNGELQVGPDGQVVRREGSGFLIMVVDDPT